MVHRLNPTFLNQLYTHDYFSSYKVFFNQDSVFHFSCSISEKYSIFFLIKR